MVMCRFKLAVAFAIGLGLIISEQVFASEDAARNYSAATVVEWKEKSFLGNTQYQQFGDEIVATSDSSASGLFLEETIAISESPYLNWEWRPEAFPTTTNEQSKQGDDFALRIYVVAKQGWGPWNTKAISYVWSAHQQAGSEWGNPYAEKNLVMIALRGIGDPMEWQVEKRDIKADFKTYFGLDIDELDGLAIMTDADNTSSNAVGYYRNLSFSAK